MSSSVVASPVPMVAQGKQSEAAAAPENKNRETVTLCDNNEAVSKTDRNNQQAVTEPYCDRQQRDSVTADSNLQALNTKSYDIHFNLTDTDYEPIENIGSGAYGVVCSAVHRRTGERVAIKKIPDIFSGGQLTVAVRTYREIKILKHFKHDNIISIREILRPHGNDWTSFRDVYIVLDLMESDLHRIIYSRQELTEEHVRYFLYQLLRGLKYIHSANVVHRDLKPSNLLVNENCDLRIGDFGMARALSSSAEEAEKPMTQYVATRWYRAPEMLLPLNYTAAVDMWSVGCILAEMLGRKQIFPGSGWKHQLKVIFDVVGTPPDSFLDLIRSESSLIADHLRGLEKKSPKDLRELFPSAGSEVLSLLRKTLVFDPRERLRVEIALTDPFLAKYHDPTDEPVCIPVFDFSFERNQLKEKSDATVMRRLIADEIMDYHRPKRSAKLMYNLQSVSNNQIQSQHSTADLCKTETTITGTTGTTLASSLPNASSNQLLPDNQLPMGVPVTAMGLNCTSYSLRTVSDAENENVMTKLEKGETHKSLVENATTVDAKPLGEIAETPTGCKVKNIAVDNDVEMLSARFRNISSDYHSDHDTKPSTPRYDNVEKTPVFCSNEGASTGSTDKQGSAGLNLKTEQLDINDCDNIEMLSAQFAQLVTENETTKEELLKEELLTQVLTPASPSLDAAAGTIPDAASPVAVGVASKSATPTVPSPADTAVGSPAAAGVVDETAGPALSAMKAKIKAALLDSSRKQRIESSQSTVQTVKPVTALQRQKEREEKRKEKLERAKEKRKNKKKKRDDIEAGPTLTDNDKSLLERWSKMTNYKTPQLPHSNGQFAVSESSNNFSMLAFLQHHDSGVMNNVAGETNLSLSQYPAHDSVISDLNQITQSESQINAFIHPSCELVINPEYLNTESSDVYNLNAFQPVPREPIMIQQNPEKDQFAQRFIDAYQPQRFVDGSEFQRRINSSFHQCSSVDFPQTVHSNTEVISHDDLSTSISSSNNFIGVPNLIQHHYPDRETTWMTAGEQTRLPTYMEAVQHVNLPGGYSAAQQIQLDAPFRYAQHSQEQAPVPVTQYTDASNPFVSTASQSQMISMQSSVSHYVQPTMQYATYGQPQEELHQRSSFIDTSVLRKMPDNEFPLNKTINAQGSDNSTFGCVNTTTTTFVPDSFPLVPPQTSFHNMTNFDHRIRTSDTVLNTNNSGDDSNHLTEMYDNRPPLSIVTQRLTPTENLTLIHTQRGTGGGYGVGGPTDGLQLVSAGGFSSSSSFFRNLSVDGSESAPLSATLIADWREITRDVGELDLPAAFLESTSIDFNNLHPL